MNTKSHILIVDDNEMLCASIKDTLAEDGYAVDSAFNGKDAIGLCQTNSYDIALIDIKLPDISGTEVVNQISKISPSMEFIYMTAHSSLNSAIEAVKQGHVISYETKPLNMDHLLSIIKLITGRKQIEALLEKSHEQSLSIIDNTTAVIYLKDKHGKYILINSQYENLFHITREDIIGKTDMDIFPEEIAEAVQANDRKALETGAPLELEEIVPHDDGPHTYISIKFPLFDSNGKPDRVCGISTDITERKHMEQQIKTSLKEKEILLKEIHHRVKNNMNVIVSLLRVQSKNINDKQFLDIFKDCESRVKSMALIHEELYKTKDLSKVDIAEYIKTLAIRITKSYEVSIDKISLRINIDDVFLGVDKAIPCGLIINEFLTNAMKYAFPSDPTQGMPEGKKGEIRIDFHSDKNKYTLVYSDNGIGLPEDLDFQNTKTLGLELVNGLTQQLGGTIELNRSGGTEFKIMFEV